MSIIVIRTRDGDTHIGTIYADEELSRERSIDAAYKRMADGHPVVLDTDDGITIVPADTIKCAHVKEVTDQTACPDCDDGKIHDGEGGWWQCPACGDSGSVVYDNHFDCGDCYEGNHECPKCGDSGTAPTAKCSFWKCEQPAEAIEQHGELLWAPRCGEHRDPRMNSVRVSTAPTGTAVTDAEVSEAWEAAYRASDISPSMGQIRVALETFAAARARSERP